MGWNRIGGGERRYGMRSEKGGRRGEDQKLRFGRKTLTRADRESERVVIAIANETTSFE